MPWPGARARGGATTRVPFRPLLAQPTDRTIRRAIPLAPRPAQGAEGRPARARTRSDSARAPDPVRDPCREERRRSVRQRAAHEPDLAVQHRTHKAHRGKQAPFDDESPGYQNLETAPVEALVTRERVRPALLVGS